MRRPTDEELDGMFEAALAKSGVEDVREVPMPEVDDDFAVFVRPLSREEYIAFANGSISEAARVNARTAGIMRAALWPSRAEINEAREVFGGFDTRIRDTIEEMAGCPNSAGAEEWIAFDASVEDDQLAELGIPVAVATDLRTRYPSKGHLWICRLRKLAAVFVLHRLGTKATDALREKATKPGEFYSAAMNAAVDAIAWPADAEAKELLEQHPALVPTVVFPQLIRLSGGSASVEAKKLVRTGRRTAT